MTYHWHYAMENLLHGLPSGVCGKDGHPPEEWHSREFYECIPHWAVWWVKGRDKGQIWKKKNHRIFYFLNSCMI